MSKSERGGRRVAIVTGASRGAGRGIASVLGERGYVVYVTGRSTRAQRAGDGMPDTVEDTAEEVTRRGGVGVPMRVDHRVDAEVETLIARVRAERGRLDLLVNNAWGGYENYDSSAYLKKFWEIPTTYWQSFFESGVRMHFVTTRYALPLMLERRDAGMGLVVSTVAWDHDKYLGSWYDVAKHSIVRFIYGLSIELRGLDVAALAVAPGFMRTERVLAAPAKDWPGGVVDLSITESPEYVGRAIAALADDPQLRGKSGKVFRSGELAAEYGLIDVDGRQVAPFTIPDPELASA
jgi:NAD(P)-dependent dehydrogenase (short-subunit alcohol dehydrogenase family)